MREIVYSDSGNGVLVAEPSPRQKRREQERKAQRGETIAAWALGTFLAVTFVSIYGLWIFYT